MTRMNQHKKEVDYQGSNRAIAKKLKETSHEIDWKEAERLERGKKKVV